MYCSALQQCLCSRIHRQVLPVPPLWCVAGCCSALQCVAVCCSVLQCVAVMSLFANTSASSPSCPFLRRDLFTCAAWLTYVYFMFHSRGWHDTSTRAPGLTSACSRTHFCMLHYSSESHAATHCNTLQRPATHCNTTHWYVLHGSLHHVTFLTFACDMAHFCTWHGSFWHVPWLISAETNQQKLVLCYRALEDALRYATHIKRALHVRKRAQYILQRTLYIYKRAFILRNISSCATVRWRMPSGTPNISKEIFISTKEPYVSAKKPYIYETYGLSIKPHTPRCNQHSTPAQDAKYVTRDLYIQKRDISTLSVIPRVPSCYQHTTRFQSQTPNSSRETCITMSKETNIHDERIYCRTYPSAINVPLTPAQGAKYVKRDLIYVKETHWLCIVPHTPQCNQRASHYSARLQICQKKPV